MGFRGKFILVFCVVFAVACKQTVNNKEVGEDTIALQDSSLEEITKKESIYSVFKQPCHKWKPVEAGFKSETTNGFYFKVTPICLGDYGVIDTLFGSGDIDTVVIRKSNNYKHSVYLHLPNDSIEYFISKKDITGFGDMSKDILVNPEIPYVGYSQRDTAVDVNLLLGKPDTDDVIICKFRVYYNKGVEYVGFEEPKAEGIYE